MLFLFSDRVAETMVSRMLDRPDRPDRPNMGWGARYQGHGLAINRSQRQVAELAAKGTSVRRAGGSGS